MSLWLLIVTNCTTIKETKIYKTQDDAVEAAIIEHGLGKLYKTPDGTVWYFLEEYTEQAIEFNCVKELVKESGVFETIGEPLESGGWGDRCTIKEVKISEKVIMKPKNVKNMKRKRYCGCCDSIFIHDLCENYWRSNKCYECEEKCSGYTDDGTCQKLRKLWQSKRKDEGWKGDEKDEGTWDEEDDKKWLDKVRYGLSTEKDDGRKSGSSTEQEVLIEVTHYPDIEVTHYPDNKGKAFRSSDGIVYIKTEKVIVAIGSDIKNTGNLCTLKTDSFLKLNRLGMKIDEGWRNWNMEPILFSEYLKMASQKKN